MSFILWFTGLSGSGKSTIADKVFEKLKEKYPRIERLDGDIVREVFPKTGFTKEERNQHINRIGFVSSLLERNDVIVVASFISPYQSSRDKIRSNCKNFIEIFVSASVEECERRDVKGLYGKARKGEILNFTGISDPYENPNKPELVLNTEIESIDESVNKVLNYILNRFKTL